MVSRRQLLKTAAAALALMAVPAPVPLPEEPRRRVERLNNFVFSGVYVTLEDWEDVEMHELRAGDIFCISDAGVYDERLWLATSDPVRLNGEWAVFAEPTVLAENAVVVG